jgi:hypothetical protein
MRLIGLGSFVSLLLFVACKPGPGSDDGSTAGSTGDSSAAGTDGMSTGGTAASEPTTGGASAETGGSNSNSGTTTGPTGDEGTSLASEPGSGGLTTGLGDGCEIFSGADACAQDPDCMAIVGVVQEFAGCTAGEQFLACVPAMPCDAVLTTVCRDGTDEVYELADGCVPPGFSPCDGPGVACGGGTSTCADIVDEAACQAAGCGPIQGFPHTFEGDVECVDFDAPKFLGCFDPETPCPPVVLTVCPEGQKEPVFDVPSGCPPAGFEDCGDGGVPECK